jgi:hypothetical protein
MPDKVIIRTQQMEGRGYYDYLSVVELMQDVC